MTVVQRDAHSNASPSTIATARHPLRNEERPAGNGRDRIRRAGDGAARRALGPRRRRSGATGHSRRRARGPSRGLASGRLAETACRRGAGRARIVAEPPGRRRDATALRASRVGHDGRESPPAASPSSCRRRRTAKRNDRAAPIRRRALVTGASGGIGRGDRRASRPRRRPCHRRMRTRGSMRPRRSSPRSSAPAAALKRSPSTSPIAPRLDAACDTLAAAGAIQIIVNNAGLHDDAVFPALRAEQWDRVIDVSVGGFFNVTQPLVMPMMRTRWGRIVNLSSIAALTGNRGQVNYAAAKGAINSATKSLALELASRGITVNAVAPGHHRCRHGAGDVRARDDREARADEARRNSRAKSPRWSRSSPPRKRATSAARSSRSTAR